MKTSSTQRTVGGKNQSSTITLSDFMRIRNTVVPPQNEDDDRRNVDTGLKAASQTRMRQWPDSIEMAKKNKLESRKKVFFEKEMEKRKIDEEERKFQEMQKKIVVERANKLLFEAQDPVKAFHSKLLLSDVIKEREFQKEIKEKQMEIDGNIEQRWREIEKEKMIDYDQKEIMKKEEEKRKKEHQMNVIEQQFNDFKIKKVKEYHDRVIEGEIIKLGAKRAIEEERQKEEDRRLKAKEQQDQFIKANIELEKIKELQRQKEKEEEKKIEEYAVKKQQMVDLRRRKEQEKFKEKQDQRQKLIDKQVEYLKNMKNREDEILSKHVKEAEEKKNREMEEKQRRFDEFKRQIDENRDLQAKRRRDIQDQEKKEDKEFIEQWKERMKQLVLNYIYSILIFTPFRKLMNEKNRMKSK